MKSKWIDSRNPEALRIAMTLGVAERPSNSRKKSIGRSTPMQVSKGVLLPDRLRLTVPALRIQCGLIGVDVTPLHSDTRLRNHQNTDVEAGFVFLHRSPEDVGRYITEIVDVGGEYCLVDQLVSDTPTVDYTPSLWALAERDSVQIATVPLAQPK